MRKRPTPLRFLYVPGGCAVEEVPGPARGAPFSGPDRYPFRRHATQAEILRPLLLVRRHLIALAGAGKAYPSIWTMAERLGLAADQVRDAVRDLAADGELVLDGKGRIIALPDFPDAPGNAAVLGEPAAETTEDWEERMARQGADQHGAAIAASGGVYEDEPKACAAEAPMGSVPRGGSYPGARGSLGGSAAADGAVIALGSGLQSLSRGSRRGGASGHG